MSSKNFYVRPHRARALACFSWAVASYYMVPWLITLIGWAFDPTMLDRDMITLYPLSRFYDHELFPRDYVADYFLFQWMPPGYLALNRAWALFADPRSLHMLLRFVLPFACLPYVWIVCERVGGKTQALAGILLFLSSTNFYWRFVGGMPHSFAFPFLWWGLAAMLRGRVRELAICTVLSAGFYPVVTPVLGLMLAIWVFFPQLIPAISGAAAVFRYSWLEKAVWIALPGLLSIVLLAMMTAQSSHYGDNVELSQDYVTYPELPREVGFEPFSYTQWAYDGAHALDGSETGQWAHRLTMLTFALVLLGWLGSFKKNPRLSLMQPYVIASVLCFSWAEFFNQAHAYRFSMYCFPLVFTVYLVSGLRQVCRFLPLRRMRGLFLAGCVVSYCSYLTFSDAFCTGYNAIITPDRQQLMGFLQSLPKDALIASWPQGDDVEPVPYVAQRQMFLLHITNARAHSKFILEQRRRMRAFDDAYFARDLKPLIRLRDEFGVDYLMVDVQQLTAQDPPSYIDPFTNEISHLWWDDARDFIVLSLYPRAGIYQQGPWQVLDLHKL